MSVCMGNAQWVTSMLCYVDYSLYDLMAYCTSADVDANADEEREHERALALTASWVPFRCGLCVGDNLRDLIYA